MSTLYLRTQEGNTLVDIEISTDMRNRVKDLHSVVDIILYSFLLTNNLDQRDYLIFQFDDLAGLRGWFFERFLLDFPQPSLFEVKQAILERYKELTKKFNLVWIED